MCFIYFSFNQVSCSRRTAAQLKCQWQIIKMAARKESSARKREVFKTGGGQLPLDEGISGDDIRSWLPNEFIVDQNEFDCDNALQQVIHKYIELP